MGTGGRLERHAHEIVMRGPVGTVWMGEAFDGWK
jgi:hypothetical protein